MYQEEQWLEDIDLSLTEQQCKSLGWGKKGVWVEMLAFLCVALMSCTLVHNRGGSHDY